MQSVEYLNRKAFSILYISTSRFPVYLFFVKKHDVIDNTIHISWTQNKPDISLISVIRLTMNLAFCDS